MSHNIGEKLNFIYIVTQIHNQVKKKSFSSLVRLLQLVWIFIQCSVDSWDVIFIRVIRNKAQHVSHLKGHFIRSSVIILSSFLNIVENKVKPNIETPFHHHHQHKPR